VSEPVAPRIAVVTGAGSGIGRAITLALADAGTTVLAADLDTDGASHHGWAGRRRGRAAGGVDGHGHGRSRLGGWCSPPPSPPTSGSRQSWVNCAGRPGNTFNGFPRPAHRTGRAAPAASDIARGVDLVGVG
jgi:NAD(P)-dependent dehydrogenase (short-subunit alcohol dehydrogenase family)